MNEIAKKWVENLENGSYEQGVGLLRQNDEFCCLGVLCDMAVKAGIIPPANKVASTWFYDGEAEILPTLVREWVGLISPNGNFGGSCLSEMNDNEKTFAEIAEFIKTEPDGLFVK